MRTQNPETMTPAVTCPHDRVGKVAHATAAQFDAQPPNSGPQHRRVREVVVPNFLDEIQVRHVLVGATGEPSEKPEPVRVTEVKRFPVPEH